MCVSVKNLDIHHTDSVGLHYNSIEFCVALEHMDRYPKDGELCLGRVKPEETLVEA